MRYRRMFTMVTNLDPLRFNCWGERVYDYYDFVNQLFEMNDPSEEELLSLLKEFNSATEDWIATVLHAQMGTL